MRDSCGKSAYRGDPAGTSRGGSRTARGKRVPGAEINVQIVQAIKLVIKGVGKYLLNNDGPEQSNTFKSQEWFSPKLAAEVDWRGRRETPAGKARLGETPQAQAEEAPGPPAESECLERKSTSKLYKP